MSPAPSGSCLPPVSVQSGPRPWAAGWEASARAAVPSPGLRAAGPGAELGGGPALSLADLRCHPRRSWSPDRRFRQHRPPTRPSPGGDAALSVPCHRSLGVGVSGCPSRSGGLSSSGTCPMAPPSRPLAVSPGVTPNKCRRHECSSQGCAASDWGDSKHHICLQSGHGHQPRCWVPSRPAWSDPGLRGSLATPCWGCESNRRGLGRGELCLGDLGENPKCVSEGVGLRTRQADILYLGFRNAPGRRWGGLPGVAR